MADRLVMPQGNARYAWRSMPLKRHGGDHYEQGPDYGPLGNPTLKPGDKLEFDSKAPVLTARWLINKSERSKALDEWQKTFRARLKGHPWDRLLAEKLADELRGGHADKAGP